MGIEIERASDSEVKITSKVESTVSLQALYDKKANLSRQLALMQNQEASRERPIISSITEVDSMIARALELGVSLPRDDSDDPPR